MKTRDFLKWLRPNPDAYGEDIYKSRLSYFLEIVLIISTVTSLLGVVITYPMGWYRQRIALWITIGINILNYTILKKGHLKTASSLTLFSLLGVHLFLIYGGNGIYAPSIIMIPFLVIIASFLLNRVYFILYSALTIISFSIVSLLWWTYKPNLPNGHDTYADLIVMVILFIIISTIMYFYTRDLLENIRKLIEREKKLKHIFENIQDVYFETSVDGKILEVSPSIKRFYPFDREMFLNKHLSLFYQDFNAREKLLELLLKHERVTNFEVTLHLYNKSYTIYLNAVLLRDKNGNPEKIVGSMRDITEKKEVEERLKQIQKMEALGTLAGGIAHDFNNILTAINGYTSMALLHINKSSPIYNDLIAIQEAAQRATALTKQILTFSRKQTPQAKSISIKEIINKIKPMASRLIGEDIEIEINIPDNLPPIKSDPSQLEQIFMNLLVNARDALKEKDTMEKKITITAHTKEITTSNLKKYPDLKEGDYVYISVKDNGIGMTPEVQSRIFDPFFTTKEKGKGTGLGLSTVFGIVKQYDGGIYVSSEPGKGTEFIILWPISTEESFTNESSSDTSSNPPVRKEERLPAIKHSKTILFVEDEKSILTFATRTLENNGYVVFSAPNGEEAFRIFCEHAEEIDLIVTDAIMPKMGGRELVTKAKQIKPEVKIIVTTGYTDENIWEILKLDKQALFIDKPYSPEKLLTYIHNILNTNQS